MVRLGYGKGKIARNKPDSRITFCPNCCTLVPEQFTGFLQTQEGSTPNFCDKLALTFNEVPVPPEEDCDRLWEASYTGWCGEPDAGTIQFCCGLNPNKDSSPPPPGLNENDCHDVFWMRRIKVVPPEPSPPNKFLWVQNDRPCKCNLCGLFIFPLDGPPEQQFDPDTCCAGGSAGLVQVEIGPDCPGGCCSCQPVPTGTLFTHIVVDSSCAGGEGTGMSNEMTFTSTGIGDNPCVIYDQSQDPDPLGLCFDGTIGHNFGFISQLICPQNETSISGWELKLCMNCEGNPSSLTPCTNTDDLFFDLKVVGGANTCDPFFLYFGELTTGDLGLCGCVCSYHVFVTDSATPPSPP